MEEGGSPDVAAKKIGLHPYAARISFEHARRFSMDDLESIYHRLLEIDTAMKTGGMPGDLALDVLVTELTVP
jgi:DNA polymerase III delta subunit